MRIVLDESVPVQVRNALSDYPLANTLPSGGRILPAKLSVPESRAKSGDPQ